MMMLEIDTIIGNFKCQIQSSVAVPTQANNHPIHADCSSKFALSGAMPSRCDDQNSFLPFPCLLNPSF